MSYFGVEDTKAYVTIRANEHEKELQNIKASLTNLEEESWIVCHASTDSTANDRFTNVLKNLQRYVDFCLKKYEDKSLMQRTQ